MAKKTTKKVDVKKVSKLELSKLLAEFLAEKGVAVHTNAEDYGFTEGTLVVETEACDVQVKFITPKAGVTKYEVVSEDTEDEASSADAE